MHILVCLFELEFYIPVNTFMVMSSRSVYLTTLFLGEYTGIARNPRSDCVEYSQSLVLADERKTFLTLWHILRVERKTMVTQTYF